MDASRALTSSRAIATSITGCGDRPLLLLPLPLPLPLPNVGIPKVIDCGSSHDAGSARPTAAPARVLGCPEPLRTQCRALQPRAVPHRQCRRPRAAQVVLRAAAPCRVRLLLPRPLPAAELLPERLQLPIEALRQAADILVDPGSQPGDRLLQLLQRVLLLAGHGCPGRCHRAGAR
jgi:hypothetical protein